MVIVRHDAREPHRQNSLVTPADPRSPTNVIGREQERHIVDASVDAARSGTPSVLLLCGEPGIGKSALLADVRARHGDANVVAAVAFESEQAIPFAALTSLVAQRVGASDHPDPEVTDRLDAVTAAAATSESLPTIGLALVELLATLVDGGLVLVVLDDVHWFDESSRAVFEFALRRLGDLPVATIAASRRRDTLDVAATVIELGPLDRHSAEILLGSAGAVVDDVSRRCWDLCGGHPLTLIELGQALTPDQRVGTRPLPELLPVPGRLESWLTERIVDLPEPTRRALATLALAGTAPVLLDTFAELGLHRSDLDPAEAAGVVVAVGPVATFTHPLFATVAAAAVDPGVRRAVHRALATTVSGTSAERQAWHLVEACETTDDIAAAVIGLRAVAERASAHNAHLTAATAWERLASLLSHPDERAAALTESGGASWDAGRPDLAVPVLRAARALVAPGPARARATDVLGQVLGWSESVAEARQMLDTEVAHVERDRPDLAVALLVSSATLASLAVSADAVTVTERAEWIARDGDDFTRLAARTIGTHVRLMAGEGLAIVDRLTDLDELTDLVDESIDRSLLEVVQLLAFGLMVREQWDAARTAYDRMVAAARTASLGGVESFGLAMSAEVAWRTGQWSRARGEASLDASFHASVAGLEGTFGDATLARVEASLGMDADARTHARRAIERGDELGMYSMSAWGRHALGLADLAAEDPETALVHLEWIWDLVRSSGATDPGLLWWQGDLLEALVAVGRYGDARRLADELARQAAATGRRWPDAIAARGFGILDGDTVALARSVSVLDELEAPFESARSRLLLASLLGGDGARVHVEHARQVFERLGATPWIRRCRVQLGDADVTDRRAVPSLAARLTPAELRVATAVGAGMTTRDAATSLALSTRTVDAHLRSIYRKLDISSRSQLAVLVSASTRDQR